MTSLREKDDVSQPDRKGQSYMFISLYWIDVHTLRKATYVSSQPFVIHCAQNHSVMTYSRDLQAFDKHATYDFTLHTAYQITQILSFHIYIYIYIVILWG
jgi:hypothetical protein